MSCGFKAKCRFVSSSTPLIQNLLQQPPLMWSSKQPHPMHAIAAHFLQFPIPSLVFSPTTVSTIPITRFITYPKLLTTSHSRNYSNPSLLPYHCTRASNLLDIPIPQHKTKPPSVPSRRRPKPPHASLGFSKLPKTAAHSHLHPRAISKPTNLLLCSNSTHSKCQAQQPNSSTIPALIIVLYSSHRLAASICSQPKRQQPLLPQLPNLPHNNSPLYFPSPANCPLRSALHSQPPNSKPLPAKHPPLPKLLQQSTVPALKLIKQKSLYNLLCSSCFW